MRPLDTLGHLKKSIVNVKAERNCPSHGLVIAIAKITNDPNYKSYCDEWNIGPVMQRLLETMGINLDLGGLSHTSLNFRNILKITELSYFQASMLKT